MLDSTLCQLLRGVAASSAAPEVQPSVNPRGLLRLAQDVAEQRGVRLYAVPAEKLFLGTDNTQSPQFTLIP